MVGGGGGYMRASLEYFSIFTLENYNYFFQCFVGTFQILCWYKMTRLSAYTYMYTDKFPNVAYRQNSELAVVAIVPPPPPRGPQATLVGTSNYVLIGKD